MGINGGDIIHCKTQEYGSNELLGLERDVNISLLKGTPFTRAALVLALAIMGYNHHRARKQMSTGSGLSIAPLV